MNKKVSKFSNSDLEPYEQNLKKSPVRTSGKQSEDTTHE